MTVVRHSTPIPLEPKTRQDDDAPMVITCGYCHEPISGDEIEHVNTCAKRQNKDGVPTRVYRTDG